MDGGKTTILNELTKRKFKKAINYTTRAPRENELLLGEYKFINKEKFEQMWNENKLLQRAEFNGEFYGLSIDSLKEDVACVQIVKSIADVKQMAKKLNLTNVKIKSFYIYVSPEERKRRMLKRGDLLENIEERIKIDKEKFKDAKKYVDYIIKNDDLQTAVDEIIKLYNQ